VGFLSDNFISDFFVLVLKWVVTIVQSYPVAIILLTIAIRVLILPLDLRQKQSARKTAMIQPKIESLKKRYANNPQQLQKKQQELMKKEGVKPLAGCLPMLITMPIFFAFFGAMRALATEQQVTFMLNAQNISSLSGFADVLHLPRMLWINNIWQADSGLEKILPSAVDFISKTIVPNMNNISPQALHMMSQSGLLNYSGAALEAGANYSGLVSTIINTNGLAGYNNGWFVLPLLAGATLFLQQKMTMGQNPQATQQQGGAFMLWFFPIFTIWICSTSSAAFSIYWLFANIYALGQTFVLNLIYKKKDEKAKGVIEEAT